MTAGPVPKHVPKYPNYPLDAMYTENAPDGTKRGVLKWEAPDIAWINTGSKCHNSCQFCFMNSSPQNDWLLYIDSEEAADLIEEAKELNFNAIGFTGGEPFMNTKFNEEILPFALSSLDVVLLTDGAGPIKNARVLEKVIDTVESSDHKLHVRLSLDRPRAREHDIIRNYGKNRISGQYEKVFFTLGKLRSVPQIEISIAGQYYPDKGETREQLLSEYQSVLEFRELGEIPITLFPKMDPLDPNIIPTITPACVEGKSYQCSSSPMACKPKSLERVAIYACTVAGHNPAMYKGKNFKEAMSDTHAADVHCYSFCLAGGANCAPKK